MFKFPRTAPEIVIEEIPDEHLKIEYFDSPRTFVLLQPGEELEYGFYQPYRRSEKSPAFANRLGLTMAFRVRVAGKLRLDGREVYELEHQDRYSEYSDLSDSSYAQYTVPAERRYEALDADGWQMIAWTLRRGRNPWLHQHWDMTPIPSCLYTGVTIRGHERVVSDKAQWNYERVAYSRSGPPVTTIHNKESEEDLWDHESLFEVVGAARLKLGPKEYRCLKAYYSYWDHDVPHTLGESYISDIGRTVLFRRYAGNTASRWDVLEGNRTIDYRGTEWRHYYDCIPDHALVIDG